ncbi:MAG: hypothetical protein KC543_01085 [Myxococcales bacterium]|nr:hypothetical protein [Myxococcales bacterium]
MEPADLLRGQPEGRTRETAIRRDAAGRWWNGADRIAHPNLTRSFDGWVDRAEDGRFCLSNDINWAYVAIEGPAYFVRSARVEPSGAVELELSGGRQERLRAVTLRHGADGALWCDVRDGRCPARFDTHAVAQLAGVVGEDARGVYLDLGGERVYPPSAGRAG